MDNKNGIGIFVFGIIVGVFLTISFILPLSGLTPKQIEKEIHQEAINRGYGQWTIVHTNTSYYPKVQFQWITK